MDIKRFFGWWENEVYSDKSKSPLPNLPPLTTLSDMRTTIQGMCALLDRAANLGQGLIPYRISQDVVENWFGHQRQAGGCNNNMTGWYLGLERLLK